MKLQVPLISRDVFNNKYNYKPIYFIINLYYKFNIYCLNPLLIEISCDNLRDSRWYRVSRKDIHIFFATAF